MQGLRRRIDQRHGALRRRRAAGAVAESPDGAPQGQGGVRHAQRDLHGRRQRHRRLRRPRGQDAGPVHHRLHQRPGRHGVPHRRLAHRHQCLRLAEGIDDAAGIGLRQPERQGDEADRDQPEPAGLLLRPDQVSGQAGEGIGHALHTGQHAGPRPEGQPEDDPPGRHRERLEAARPDGESGPRRHDGAGPGAARQAARRRPDRRQGAARRG